MFYGLVFCFIFLPLQFLLPPPPPSPLLLLSLPYLRLRDFVLDFATHCSLSVIWLNRQLLLTPPKLENACVLVVVWVQSSVHCLLFCCDYVVDLARKLISFFTCC